MKPIPTELTVDEEAWAEWERLATTLRDRGFGDLVVAHQPPTGSDWRRVGEHDRALRRAVAAERVRREGRP